MELSIQSNVNELARTLPRFYRKQIPFATSQALNDAARTIAMKDTRADLARELDTTNRFTRMATTYKRSTKARLVSQIVMGQQQWTYLKINVNAGTRRPKGQVIVIPTPAGQRLRKKNPRGWMQAALKNKAVHWADIGGTYGLWRTDRRGNNTLLAYTTGRATYGKSFDYMGSVERGVRKHFNVSFAKRMRRAIDTARV